MKYKTLVIGSSSGIGFAITEKLLKEGQEVTGVSRRNLNINDKNYKHLKIDVKSKNFVSSINNHQKIDYYNNIIFCTGQNKVELAKNLKRDDINHLLEVNLIPAILISSEFAKSRDISQDSSILFIGSIWSSFGLEGRSVYGATKAAIVGFSKHLSAELSKNGCLVNVLSPGFTDTPLTQKTICDQKIKNVIPRVNTRKLLNSKDIASHAMMLIAPNNKCITGQEIFTDGGFTAHA
tara:strand:+ start:1834 stop:2541 length:708 start_codon:yes stop_codon:yes gene_type:complete